MKSPTLIFIRHAETQKDPTVNASKWNLSDVGKVTAKKLEDDFVNHDISQIFVSSEQKTFQTIQPLAERLGLDPIVEDSFDEVRRGDIFLSNEDFKKEKIKQLQDTTYNAFNGESVDEALQRFEKRIEDIVNSMQESDTIIIVSHGTILNAYFAKLLNAFDNIVSRWENTKFGAYGVVRDGVVVKDLK